ncbi:hypothetical protein TPHA_0G03520 [Tetrapisispora phaffii CBS 4417]|uniref:Golgi apparatus membrane protein TVP18 n=1 Tax=Tetrapisispora phaffii (strain ATCC 24235 / CBS 4417 / NBRC 1672 / NRRL Y-8282 / UCD 70-5) TaxID=1071381 RepID=G8BWB4_TETPH|nr:hypothetical protein TPHA_0G03520 [Tetrapisispora phaffii CBS 4417]CCE64192.1 hypothetical protein TPHA_0G03520 [Tetrapisispora phaffii CBS 4417]
MAICTCVRVPLKLHPVLSRTQYLSLHTPLPPHTHLLMALSIKQFINGAGMLKDLKSFNFSVYGQYFGYINIILCMALGIANLFHVNAVIAFGIVAIVQSLVILFIEIPFLLKICPLSDNFVNFVKYFETNGWRCLFFTGMAIVQWCSLILKVTSLIVVAIGLSISAAFYAIAFFKKQEFQHTSNVIKNPTDDDFPHEAVVREML